MGVAVPLPAYQCLLSKYNPSDWRPVSFGMTADYESTPVFGHYAIALSSVASQ